MFDKAYVDFKHLFRPVLGDPIEGQHELYRSGRTSGLGGTADYSRLIVLNTDKGQTAYPEPLRLVTAQVEINDKFGPHYWCG